MCTIAGAKVQLNYNCYNVYFNECLQIKRKNHKKEVKKSKESMTEPVSKSLLLFETVCSETPHCLCNASAQPVLTSGLDAKQAILVPESGYIRP